MRKFTITNETTYSTRDLRRFLVRVANQTLDPEQLQRVNVKIVYNRGAKNHNYCSGWAYYGTPRSTGSMRIMLPSGSASKVDLALVIAHELGHCLGLHHADMRGNAWYNRVGDWTERYAWANDLPLTRSLPKGRKVGADLAGDKLAHVQAKVKQWESKVKSAQTRLKGWRQREKYYAKRVAALSVPAESTK